MKNGAHMKNKSQLKIKETRRQRSNDFRSVYAGDINSTSSFYDLTLIFGQFRNQAGEWIIEESVAVTIAWEHAVRFHTLLGRLVEDYEREHGKIRVKPA